VLHYCFRASANSAFQRRADAAIAVVKRGGEVHEGLAGCGAPFPEDFLQSVAVAEEAGQVSEVMERLADNYREEGERRLKAAAQLTSYAIYGLVALGIILAIFGIASGIQGVYRDATKGL
jgi:type II secretory pathway component PulF